MPLRVAALTALLIAALAPAAGAIVHPGDLGPNFTKDRLDYPTVGQITPTSIYDFRGKVIVLFVLGYS